MGRLDEFKRKFAVQMGGRNQFQARQGFDAALGLHGLGGFGFKTVDKRLQMGDVGLLLHISRLLLCQTQGAFAFVKIVIAAIHGEFLL